MGLYLSWVNEDIIAFLFKFEDYRIEKYLVTNAFHMIQIGTNKALENYLLFQKNYDGYEHLIPQHLIAAYLGITPTQLSRIKKTLSGSQQARKRITS